LHRAASPDTGEGSSDSDLVHRLRRSFTNMVRFEIRLDARRAWLTAAPALTVED